MPLPSPVHLNSEPLCAVGVRQVDNILHELAVVQLDSKWEPIQESNFFHVRIKPVKKYDAHFHQMSRQEYTDAQIGGIDYHLAGDLFVEWKERLKLFPTKKIVVVAHQWAYEIEAVRRWLGTENFDYCFSDHYRDLYAGTSFANDLWDMRNFMAQFPKTGLQSQVSRLGVEQGNLRSALDRARAVADCYRTLIRFCR